MNNYQLKGNSPNLQREQFVFTNSLSTIKTDKLQIDRVDSVFETLYSNPKNMYTSNDLNEAVSKVRERNIAKMRVLKQEQNKGFISITLLTIFGFAIIGYLIFSFIGNLIK